MEFAANSSSMLSHRNPQIGGAKQTTIEELEGGNVLDARATAYRVAV